jgi:hypothetical protein
VITTKERTMNATREILAVVAEMVVALVESFLFWF